MSVLVTDLTVADDDSAVLLITFTDLATFVGWVDDPSEVKEIVSGLGDAGYIGPVDEGSMAWLAFRQGSRAVRLVNYEASEDDTDTISAEQLRGLADLIASRIK